MAFIMIKFSGVGSGKDSFPTLRHFACLMLSSSKGNPATAISTSTPVGLWRTRKTRERWAKATGLSMRGTNPKRSPALMNVSHWDSSSEIRTSTSRVNRGRPSKDAATPPMIRDEIFSASSQSISGPSVASGVRPEDFLATIDPAETRPSSSYFFHTVGAGMIRTEVFAPCHERVQLLELARNGCFA